MKTKSFPFLIKNITILLASVLFYINGFSQQPGKIVKVNSAPSSSASLKMISPVKNSETAEEGTFQIVRVHGEVEDVVPQSLIDQIESYRIQDQTIYIKAGENTLIKILSYNEILAPGFKPVAGVIYIEGKLDK